MNGWYLQHGWLTGRAMPGSAAILGIVLSLLAGAAQAQNGSLLGQSNNANASDRSGNGTPPTRSTYANPSNHANPSSPANPSNAANQAAVRRPLSLASASWTYQPLPEPKVWKLNDQVTVVIEEKAQMRSEGQVDQRKKVEGAMALTDWLSLDGWAVIPDPQSAGDPKIAGIVDNKYRAQANLKNNDLFQSKIHCTVVDVRPNGLLVIEGHDKVQIDEEEWELSFSGIINPDDILADAKTIKSEKVSEKRVMRRSAGHGRDGIRRGWLGRFLDKYQPF
jgi:flagellar L-ring protein FlgH